MRRVRWGAWRALYDGGADPVMVLQDLLELVHFLTRLKLVPEAGEGDPVLERRARARPGAGGSARHSGALPAPGRCC